MVRCGRDVSRPYIRGVMGGDKIDGLGVKGRIPEEVAFLFVSLHHEAPHNFNHHVAALMAIADYYSRKLISNFRVKDARFGIDLHYNYVVWL